MKSLCLVSALAAASCAQGCGGAQGGPTGDGSSCSPDSAPQSIVINFDELTDRTDVAAQYAPHATFSTMQGQLLQARAFGSLCGTSVPLELAAGPSGQFTAPLYVDFGSPAHNLRFTAGCIETVTGTAFAHARLVRPGQTDAMIDLASTGYTTALDLSTYGAISRLEITNVMDASGVSWDDFRFDIH
jgi:hypothetical protein